MPSREWSQEEIGECVNAVLRSRRSVRAYRADPVRRSDVLDILQVAARAPSNSNTQPWRVYVVTGPPMQALGEALVAAFREDKLPPSRHFPDPLPEDFGRHHADFAQRYYGCLGIDRSDGAARARQTLRNFGFFGAPVGLIFTIDSRLTRHSWLDLGLFVQNVMIAAKARGLDTCPQVSFARFHPVIASQLRIPEGEVTACGMSMGYGDMAAAVNRMQMPRRPVQDFARLVGFDG
ncbi:nitroreductase [Ramlibacter henchirensis]|uniref:Nitroreductase n=1 Tax=Ramlibacter henchirensis TaxID=204072 RepID=A0A4Z0C6D6_9BURK|nr:nitroreductase [Ramlibacter henchirensis]TFZ05659.1 nitroreductase [Ramlibacter henchirensis]